MRRVIPPEDFVVMRGLIPNPECYPDYPDGVYCECGVVIYFKNRKPYEPVSIICPRCGKSILYG